MPSPIEHTPSNLLQYLPAIYQEDPFLGQFLIAFEKVLLGRKDHIEYAHSGLEQLIASVADCLDPETAPVDFLPWLSTWTGFLLRADLDTTSQRRFLANILQLYRWRGTKQNLQTLLQIFTNTVPTIEESEDRPYHFTVTINLSSQRDKTIIARQNQIANALIAIEKPAHTEFELRHDFPSMQVGVSRVGVDTMLGTGHKEQSNG